MNPLELVRSVTQKERKIGTLPRRRKSCGDFTMELIVSSLVAAGLYLLGHLLGLLRKQLGYC